MFGAVHVYGVSRASIISEGTWETPLGDLDIDATLSRNILDESEGLITINESPHEKRAFD